MTHLLGLTAAILIASAAVSTAQAPSKEVLRKLTKEQRKQLQEEIQAGADRKAVLAKAMAMVAKQADRAKPAAKPAPSAKSVDSSPAIAPPIPAAKPAAPVDPKLLTPAALARLIDEEVDRTLAVEKLTPSPLSTDAEFLRRVYLDLTGVIPTVAQARAFLDSTAPNKRAQLVDELLASSNYGKHLADFWQARLLPRDSDSRFILREPFYAWMTDKFNKNTPWDQFVRDVVAGTGTVADNAGVTFFLANRTVDKITDQVSENFLGIQLECAQCHNHPFTKWKQTEYWGMAAFFSKVVPDRPKNPNRGGDNATIGVKEGATKTRAKDFFPESAKDVPAKFLGGPEPKLTASEPYRPTFAVWLTAADNPYFARAAVNRTWSFLFGDGIVSPVDDMHESNPASHPELLTELSRRFAASGFDMKNLVRGICLSHAYQRTSKPASGNEDAEEVLLSRQMVKVMTPEQLYDSVTLVLGAASTADVRKRPAAAAQTKNQNGPRDQFVQFFLAGSEEANRTEYEAGIPQALRMMNSRMVGGNPNTARQIVGTATGPQAIETLYLATVSRRPTAIEATRMTEFMKASSNTSEAYSDILWALLNSTEFTSVR